MGLNFKIFCLDDCSPSRQILSVLASIMLPCLDRRIGGAFCLGVSFLSVDPPSCESTSGSKWKSLAKQGTVFLWHYVKSQLEKCFCLREPVFWGGIFLILRGNFPNMEEKFSYLNFPFFSKWTFLIFLIFQINFLNLAEYLAEYFITKIKWRPFFFFFF